MSDVPLFKNVVMCPCLRNERSHRVIVNSSRQGPWHPFQSVIDGRLMSPKRRIMWKTLTFSTAVVPVKVKYDNSLSPPPDALPFGSHCSFERDACGWSVSNRHSAWRMVAGDELLEREDMQGVTLQSTPGWLCVCVCVQYV